MWALGDKSSQDTSDSDNFTFLGKGVDFKGVLNFDGTIRIDGRVEGEVHTTGTLIIGEQAVIKGILSAGTLMTSGKVNGTVTATAKIQILKPGVLIGDIRTPGISIEDGATSMACVIWELINGSMTANRHPRTFMISPPIEAKLA